MRLSSRAALILFIVIVVVAFAQAVWWIMFMAMLVDEKVDIAEQLGASPQEVELIHQQEMRRQVMVGLEGLFFLTLILAGAWLIYRSLVKTEQLKFNQQNFMMAVTHELKTPLASMLVTLDALGSEKIPAEKKASLVPRMKDDVRRLEKLIDNVLQAGRFGRHESSLNTQPVNLSRLVSDSLERLTNLHTEVPLAVKQSIEPGIMMQADPASLSRAIEAVLENSLKYHNGRQIEIDVSLARQDSQAVLRVADKGVGIKKEHLTQVFERFYRVGSELTRARPGSGLGLYLANEIVRAHRGKMTAHSEGPGKGAAFTMTFKIGDSK
jgi:signal transduction histidine kinase